MAPIRFGMVGGGWRALFYLRIARALPEKFHLAGMVVRDPEKGVALEGAWSVPTYRTLDEVLQVPDLSFVVVSVPWEISPPVLQVLARHGVPMLAETPPAPDLPGLIALYELVSGGAKIQVAEQYHLQPLHAARLALARSGKLGTVTQAQVSVAHGYHGISLMRRFLGVSFENVAISARRFVSPLIAGPDRSGPPSLERRENSEQTIATFDFGERLGIYDFSGDQYFSWIRSPRLLVRGERGEINNTQVRYLVDAQTPITYSLVRQDAGEEGNLEGYYHKGILAGSEWAYHNPFVPARLSDDEIAIASCLEKMDGYARGGTEFYSLAEAAQDHYLNLLMGQALTSGEVVRSTTQPWSEPR